MKRLIMIFFSLVMVCCLSTTVFAADFYEDTGLAQYTLSIPNSLRPGSGDVVRIEGTWPEWVKVVVSTRNKLKMENITTGEIEKLDINFDGISLVGNGDIPVSASGYIEIEDMNIRFGRWSGSVSYSVDVIEMTILNVYGNGGETLDGSSIIKYGEVQQGEILELPDMFYREGHTLIGFSEDPTAENGDFAFTVPNRTGCVELYAVWSEIKSEPTCTCGEGVDTHVEECPLYVAPEPTESVSDSVYEIADDTEIVDIETNDSNDSELVCSCGTEIDIHIEGCPLYAVVSEDISDTETEEPTITDNENSDDNSDEGSEVWESPGDRESGGQDPPSTTSSTIQFMISDTSYEVPSDFTWQDFVGSEYNLNSVFEIVDNQVFYNGVLVGLDSETAVQAADIITEINYVLIVLEVEEPIEEVSEGDTEDIVEIEVSEGESIEEAIDNEGSEDIDGVEEENDADIELDIETIEGDTEDNTEGSDTQEEDDTPAEENPVADTEEVLIENVDIE